MQVIGDKVLIRFTNEAKESIFSKWIQRDDGSKVQLFINVDADSGDERKMGLFVQTGIIEDFGKGYYCKYTGDFMPVKNLQKGDIAIVDYMLCNDESRIFYKDESGDVFWTNAITTYHEKEEIVYANRRTPRDTIIAKKGDIDVLSALYGVIRGDELIARPPFIFLNHEPNVIQKVTAMHIVYKEEEKVFTRKVLSCSPESTKKYVIENGDEILVRDEDIFSIKLENRKIDCVMDMDVLMGRKKDLVVKII